MEPRAEDYYDMPIELLPSANFAGQAISDISMLDGLWTMIISSSDDEDDDEEGPTTPERSPPQTAETQPTGPNIRPDIRISSSSREGVTPRLGSLSNDVKIMERPPPRKKSNTAPSGAIPSIDIVSLPPKRAISTRRAPSDHTGVKNVQLSHEDGGSRTGGRTVKRKFSTVKFPPPQRPLPPVPAQKDAASGLGTREAYNSPSSFSQKLRVHKTLRQKQVGLLKTDVVDHDSRRAPTSANSMLTTPRELYAIPEKPATYKAEPEPQVIHDAPSEVGNPQSQKRRSRRSISPATASPAAQSLVQARALLRRTNDAEGEDLSRSQKIYVPGAIILEEHPAMPRRDSVATLDPFDSPPHKTHRFSDMIVENAIIMFFDDFGVVEDVTEASVDRYWLDSSWEYNVKDDEPESAWRRPTVASLTETTPMNHQMAHSLHGSRFSFSSASSNTSAPSMGKSPRNRLGRLLSPALPGTAFLRAPAMFEKQAKKRQMRNEGG